MEDRNNRKTLYITALSAASITVCIGAVVLLLWHLRIPDIIEKYHWVFFMQYLTALLFLISGVGLMAKLKKMLPITVIGGGSVFIVGLIILIEYVVGHDLYIDELLMVDYIHPDTAHPGRPAPNTAISFMGIGLALILLAINHKSGKTANAALVELIGFFVFALGAYAIAGYLQSVEKAYAWGTDTRMAPHTALANMAVGIGLMSMAWRRQKIRVARVPLWVPAVICFLALQADLAASPAVIVSIVYIPLVFCSLWFTLPRTAFIFAAIASLLVILRYFMLPAEYMTAEVLANRLLTTGTIWAVALLIYWQRHVDMKFQRSEKYLRAIVENTIEGLIVIDEKGTVKSFNRACEAIFQYAASEVIGKNVNMLMPSHYRGEHDKYLHNYLTTGDRQIIGIGREVEGRRKDGSLFPMDLSVSEMVVEGDRFFSGIVRDITDRKQSEEELLRSNTELERFAFVAAHDLQEPLRIVMKSTEFLKEDYADSLDEQAVRFIDNAHNAAKRMRDLVRDLLEYSRIGNEEYQYGVVPLRKIITMALDNLDPDIQARKAEIIIDDTLPDIRCNSIQFVRLYQNLISNALKYSRKEETPRIVLHAEEGEADWILSVTDNGIGVEKQYLKDIFMPFKRLHTIREYPGTGMGLATCKKIVEAHNGHIWADSQPLQGSAFYFTISKNI